MRINDVAFPVHSIFTIVILIGQAIYFNPATARPTATCVAVCSLVATGIAATAAAGALGVQSAQGLGLLYVLSYVKIFATAIKYIPQVGILSSGWF